MESGKEEFAHNISIKGRKQTERTVMPTMPYIIVKTMAVYPLRFHMQEALIVLKIGCSYIVGHRFMWYVF
jgi:hypothetical protein